MRAQKYLGEPSGLELGQSKCLVRIKPARGAHALWRATRAAATPGRANACAEVRCRRAMRALSPSRGACALSAWDARALSPSRATRAARRARALSVARPARESNSSVGLQPGAVGALVACERGRGSRRAERRIDERDCVGARARSPHAPLAARARCVRRRLRSSSGSNFPTRASMFNKRGGPNQAHSSS